MDRKEIQEIRKTMTKDRCVIDRMTGCFVGEDGTIITQLKQTFRALQEEELEKYCELFRKTLTGKIGKNLFTMEFPLQEEQTGGKQAMMFRMLQSDYSDEELNNEFFTHILEHLDLAGRHLIVLAHGVYDVPGRSSDGIDMEDASENVYSFMVCCICPVVEVKEGLCYDEETLSFLNKKSDLGVQMPELGFLFPAFDGRQTNLYNCLYYTRSAGDNHPELIEALFHITPPLPADEQKGSFDALLSQTLGDECSMEAVQAVQADLRERIEVHKETKSDEPLVVSGPEVRAVLENAGVSEEKLAGFQVKFEETFGDDAALSPRNLVDSKRMQLKTPDVIIHVAPDRGDLVETRTLGGVKYIMVRAEDGVELNGVDIQIDGN